MRGSLSSITEWDYFKVVLTTDTAFKVQLGIDKPGQGFSHYLSLLNSSFDLLSSTYIGNGVNGEFSVGLTAGTYYLGVHNADTASFLTDQYSLHLSALADDSLNYEREGNGTTREGLNKPTSRAS